MNDRAIVYRRKYGIPAEWGTAVNVQAMVFGNTGDRSGSGVAFTRDPATGEKVFYGEYLMNAQGEDVVAGVRTPQPVEKLKEVMPQAHAELERIRKILEQHFKDMQDFEFTIEDGKVFMLQTRNGKRTGFAAVRIACEMVKEGLIDWKTAVRRVPAEQLDQVLAPGLRSRCDEGRQGHCQRFARRSRRRHWQDLSQRRPRCRRRPERGESPPGSPRNLAGRPARHDRRRRHPHRSWWC